MILMFLCINLYVVCSHLATYIDFNVFMGQNRKFDSLWFRALHKFYFPTYTSWHFLNIKFKGEWTY